MNISFTKMHGAHNDFVMIDNRDGAITLSPETIQYLCNRTGGIGADGVILVESDDTADCFMNYYNSDGTVSEMCGNGVRCCARFMNDHGFSSDTIRVATRSGIKVITRGASGRYSVVMGQPQFVTDSIPDTTITIENLSFDSVSMGNPHTITWVPRAELSVAQLVGPIAENDAHFPFKTNVEFVEIMDPSCVRAIVWERGCGITQACGTGACAIYAVGRKQGLLADTVTVALSGGDLIISSDNDGSIIMEGPTEVVFRGEIEIRG